MITFIARANSLFVALLAFLLMREMRRRVGRLGTMNLSGRCTRLLLARKRW